MSDIQLDLEAASTARSRVQGAITVFENADRVGDDVAALTGEPRLAGKVRDFAGNWDYHRGKLLDQLTEVRDWLEAIEETFTELDRSMSETGDAR